MPRTRRKISSTGIYHITIRSINQQELFIETQDCKKFLYILADSKQKYNFTVYGYCLMSNHVHLLIKEGEIPLQIIMRSFGSRFVHWYNTQYERTGHLFQGRYGSRPVETEKQLLTVLNYIHENPVRAQMIRYAVDYPYSSCRAYYGSKNPLVDIDFPIQIAGSKKSLQDFFAKCSYDDEFVKKHEPEVIRSFLQDSYAKQIFRKVTSCKSPSDFQKLKKVERDEYIYELAAKGLTQNQIARLGGISRVTVSRNLKDLKKA